jgi:glycolate oxidase FAD binding subunit
MQVDSIQVDRVLTPSTSDELSELMREEAGTVAPVGAGTQLTLGNPLRSVDAVIETRRLDRITEYVPADLTIHVESGLRLHQLEAALGEHKQMLPLDPWTGSDATIGGIVATNSQGPLRGVGTVRDWIIGMHVVHAGGRSSKTGGRVVKNVSGYDLAKLYTGSLGSLAVISEISFKLRATFEATATARLEVADLATASEMVRQIRTGPLEPISLVWCGPRHTIVVRFGEHPSAVAWQLDNLPEGDWTHFDQEAEAGVWADVRRHYQGLIEPVVRVGALPSQVYGILERYKPQSWIVHAANGVILMTVDPEGIPIIRQDFPAILERAPIEVRRRIPTFGVTGDEYDLMRRMKATFDPDSRLNPGRHVDGERPE